MRYKVLVIAMLLITLPTTLMAHEIGSGEGTWDVSALVNDFAMVYSQELLRGANTMGLRLGTDVEADSSLADPQQTQAKDLVRGAFRSVIRRTVEQVDILRTLKTYGERFSFTQLRVSSGDVRMSGPSLRKLSDDPAMDGVSNNTVLSVKSGMSLTDSIHLAPMVQARLGDLSSKVVYDPFAGGDWRFSLDRSITSQSALEMVYLIKDADERNLLATFRIGF